MSLYPFDHLQELEAESMYILRETAARFRRPVLLFSGGKDSIVVSWLTRKAFFPARIPFLFLHIDTGHNFPETLTFRDNWVASLNGELIVRYVQATIDAGKVVEEKGLNASRNAAQSVTLMDAIRELSIDAAIGGARRDEEKARSKERFFSHRTAAGQWQPENQRPELRSLFNTQMAPEEHFRVFPLSNWTERDVWDYIQQEQIPVPSLYFAHERDVFERNGTWYAASEFMQLDAEEVVMKKKVRFRTVGDMTCTGALLSEASKLDEIILELKESRTTERGTRMDDRRAETAMEDRKRKGYF